jgi:hypothetical protein
VKNIILFISALYACFNSSGQFYTDNYLVPENKHLNYTNLFFTTWENDFFLKTDYYYTNGVAFEYLNSNIKVQVLDKFLSTPFTYEVKNHSISVRQNMYTPEGMYESEILRNDRPYAGYLTLDYKTISRSTNKQFSSSLTIGIIGEGSLAGATQIFVHSMDHLEKPVGWKYQMNNAPVINLNYKHQHRIIKHDIFDLQYGISGRLGSLYTDASGEATIRIGMINSLFGIYEAIPRFGGLEFYTFFTAEGRISFYDATLQGTILSYHASQHFFGNDQRYLLVTNLSTGLVISYNRFRLSSSVVKISPEFKGGKSHAWGSVSIGIAF